MSRTLRELLYNQTQTVRICLSNKATVTEPFIHFTSSIPSHSCTNTSNQTKLKPSKLMGAWIQFVSLIPQVCPRLRLLSQQKHQACDCHARVSGMGHQADLSTGSDLQWRHRRCPAAPASRFDWQWYDMQHADVSQVCVSGSLS